MRSSLASSRRSPANISATSARPSSATPREKATGVVREYVGHGVGRSLHEEPNVLHHGKPGTGVELRTGMVFTIEPMLNAGGAATRLMPDQWTVKTADGSRSAQFEHTLAITENGPELLTVL